MNRLTEFTAQFETPQRAAAAAFTVAADRASMVPEAISGRHTGVEDAPRELGTRFSVAHETSASAAHLAQAQESANLCETFLRLTQQDSFSVTAAARQLGRPPSMFSGANSILGRYLRGGLAALLPRRRAGVNRADLTQAIEDLPWFIPAAKFFYSATNYQSDRGSLPEAIRRTISLPHLPAGWKRADRERFLRRLNQISVPACPEQIREAILARQSAGQPLVPDRVARQITISRVTTRAQRHATNASLDYLNAAGSLFFFNDPITGERRPPTPGEVIEADDSTINFPCCVPWTRGGDPCSEKFGVKVGRFQWLVSIDAARRFVTAWSYVMRPRSSYRAEDILALMRAHCLQHGIPLVWRFEQGTWKSKLVQQAIRQMGSHPHTVWSPHQKPYIEGLFNALWTKLAVQFPGADLGRFRGENEDANLLLTACQRGHQDPRKHFPMLQAALAAFTQTVSERNTTPVQSDIGSWTPATAWSSRDTSRLRRLDPESSWIFAPMAREWTVKGMLVGGRIPLFEDLSVPFDFSASWLTQFDGAKVRCHFDPASPRCQAAVVLVDLAHAHGVRPDGTRAKPGDLLGFAAQINEVAGYARLVLGWGDDPTQTGRLARQQAASALRREVRAVDPVARAYTASEERNGIDTLTSLESHPPVLPAPQRTDPPRTSKDLLPGSSETTGEALPANRAEQLREMLEFEKQHQALFD